MKKVILTAVVVAVLTAVAGLFLVRSMMAGYQRDMDQVRLAHCDQILDAVRAYAAQNNNRYPLQEHSTAEKPLMVILGHSVQHEDAMAGEKVLARGANFTNGGYLEAELSKGLGRPIRLPRDPQSVPTFAPNVYVYYVTPDSMTVAVHLAKPSDKSQEYQWRDGVFHSHALSYANKKAAEN